MYQLEEAAYLRDDYYVGITTPPDQSVTGVGTPVASLFDVPLQVPVHRLTENTPRRTSDGKPSRMITGPPELVVGRVTVGTPTVDVLGSAIATGGWVGLSDRWLTRTCDRGGLKA